MVRVEAATEDMEKKDAEFAWSWGNKRLHIPAIQEVSAMVVAFGDRSALGVEVAVMAIVSREGVVVITLQKPHFGV